MEEIKKGVISLLNLPDFNVALKPLNSLLASERKIMSILSVLDLNTWGISKLQNLTK